MADSDAMAFALQMSRELVGRLKTAEAEGPLSTFWRDPIRYGIWIGQAVATLEEIMTQAEQAELRREADSERVMSLGGDDD